MGRHRDRGGRRRSGADGVGAEPAARGDDAVRARAPRRRRAKRPAATASSSACCRWRRAPRSSPTTRSRTANELPLPGEAIGYLGWRRDQDYLPAADGRAGRGQRAGRRPRSDPGRQLAARAAWTPTGKKLSEARGRRGERVALRNVLVPPGTAAAVPGRVRGLRLERRPALRHARQRRAAEGRAPRRSPTTTPRTRRRSPTAPCRATSRAATSTSSATPSRAPVDAHRRDRAARARDRQAGDRQRGRASCWRAASRPGRRPQAAARRACASKAAPS